jgi:hypothetical protein
VSTHPGRVAASVLLIAGGFVVATAALAILVAQLLVDRGMAVSASDAALLQDLVAIVPFIAGFALVNVLAAAGLLAGRTWADSVAVGAAGVATIAGLLGLVLVVVGRDPFAPVGAAGTSTEGIGILVAFTTLYTVVLFALAAARPRATSIMGAAA